MELAEKARGISDAIEVFLLQGGDRSELLDVLTAWAVAITMIGRVPREDDGPPHGR